MAVLVHVPLKLQVQMKEGIQLVLLGGVHVECIKAVFLPQ
jgi:hypothetical protein